MFVGWLVLKGQYKGIQVFFDKDFSEQDPATRFFLFAKEGGEVIKDKYLLVNNEEIAYLDYWKE